MRKLAVVTCCWMGTFLHSFAQNDLKIDSLAFPKIIYKINPLSLFETPQNLLFGVEKPFRNRLAWVQEISLGCSDLDYYNKLFNTKGTTEIRRYFWQTFRPKKQTFRNKYLAFDIAYRYVQFEMDEWVGRNCNSWGWNCNYFERIAFTVQNYNLCTHLKYGKQIQTPIKGILLDYFVGISYGLTVGRLPLSDEDGFRDGQVQAYYFTLVNDQQLNFTVTAGLRLGFTKYN